MFPDAKIIDINLTTKDIRIDTMPGYIHQKYPGGSALGMYYLLKELEPGIEPLSPDNILIFSVSPLTGFTISGQSRMTATTKSPLTGGAGDSQVGGYLPAHFKANGYDALIIRGKSEKPVYIYINNEDVRICDGENAWGKITGEAEDVIREELGEEKVEFAVIGPAGENLVKYASIMHKKSRAFGRNGTGAVMGSKNLKGLVVKNQRMPKPYDMEKFKELVKTAKQDIEENGVCVDMKANGTDGCLGGMAESGFLPTRNWQSGWLKSWKGLDGSTLAETIKLADETCFACGIKCKQVVAVEGKVDPQYGGPEYETCATFGSYCGVSDLKEVAYANMLCNMYGMDTISCGSTLSFAMECYEKGLLTKEDTDGIELKFGDSSNYEEVLTNIAYRKGKLGNLLAEGSYRAGEIIGNGAVELSMSCKKQEMPAHMPQYKPSLAVIYSVNSFGADHQSSEHDGCMAYPLDSKERGWMSQVGGNFSCNPTDAHVLNKRNVIWGFNTQKFYSALDSLCLCMFAWGTSWQLYGPEHLVHFCKSVIGWDTSVYELMEIGERRLNMMRYFNAREGFTKKEDTLPKRLFKPFTDGPSTGACVDEEKYNQAKEFYYDLAGWNKEDGNPTEGTLTKLSLEWLIA